MLNKYEVIISALSIAWFIVYAIPRIKLTNRKPFNCLMCMTGWTSLGISLLNGYEWSSVYFMFIGVFVGGLFEAVKMRWL